MSLRYDICTIRVLQSMVEEFATLTNVAATEYADEKLEDESSHVDEETAKMFVKLQRNRKFLDEVVLDFCCFESRLPGLCKLGRAGPALVIMYLAIFELRPDNFDFLLKSLKEMLPVSAKVFQYLKVDEHLLDIVGNACGVFGNDYVLGNVVNPLLGNSTTISAMYAELRAEAACKKLTLKKPATVPKPPKCATVKERVVPSTPVEAPKEQFRPKPVPRTNRDPNTSAQKELVELKQRNLERAKDLLRFAQENAFRCAQVKRHYPQEPPKPPPIKHRPPPKFQPVEVRTTTSVVMREAAMRSREVQHELKQLENLAMGSVDPANLKLLEEETRKSQDLEALQELERKHLLGLITYEEAILAKKRLQKANRDKFKDFQAYRAKLLQRLDEWRTLEQRKNRQMVLKAHTIERAAKEAEAGLLKQRRCNAKLLDYETKVLLQKAYEEREAELQRKIELIRELKTLQQINMRLCHKEFDKTETANLGLLCEMSIAELQERLNYMRLEVREELEERRKKIAEDRARQREMVDCLKRFVECAKPKRKVKESPKKPVVQDTPLISELKRKLEETRQKRQLL